MSKPAEKETKKETTPPVEKEKGAEEKADEVEPSTDDAEVKKGDAPTPEENMKENVASEEPSKTAASPRRLKAAIKAARETEETSSDARILILEAEVRRLKNKIAKIKGLLPKDSGFVDSSDDEVDTAKSDGKNTNDDEWLAAWRRRKTSDQKGTMMIGITEAQGRSLMALQTHYECIVSLFYCLWRKMLILQDSDWSVFSEGHCPPPLTMKEKRHPVPTAALCMHQGISGALDKLFASSIVPPSFANAKPKKLSRDSLQHYPGAAVGEEASQPFEAFFCWAIRSNQLDVVSILVDAFKVDLDETWCLTEMFQPLHLAASGSSGRMVALLLEQGAQLEAPTTHDGFTALHRAAQAGNSEAVLVLLSKGAKVEATEDDGWTPLLHAVDNGHLETVKILLGRGGANAAAKADDGSLPLHFAAQNGSVHIIQLFLEEFASDVNVRDNSDGTPLLCAARSGHTEAMELLIKAGANIEATTNDTEWNALHYAASAAHGPAVELLIAQGLDVDAMDHYGRTALRIAKDQGHTEVMALLVRLGAKYENVSTDHGIECQDGCQE